MSIINTLRKIKNFLPAEIAAIASVVALFSIAKIYSLTIYYPDSGTIFFAAYHYLGPLIPAIAFSLLLWHLTKSGSADKRIQLNNNPIRNAVALGVTVFVHFNLKLWSQIINPQRFDIRYQEIDEEWPRLLTSLEGLGHTMSEHLTLLPHAYHEVFIAMFFISFLVHGTVGQKWVLDHLSGAISFVLLIGGLSYSIAPALGPFIFVRSDNPVADGIQQYMLVFYTNFVASQGQNYSPSFFVAALAAMPSLHLAHSIVFGYFAFTHTRYLGWIYVLPIFYISCEAVSSKWHYLIDLPAGALIAFLSIALVRIFSPATERSNLKHIETKSTWGNYLRR